jgi:hypothetical protein
MPKVYCSWIESDVDEEDLNEHCISCIVDGKCNQCERSEQLNYGVLPKELIPNIKRSQ